MKNNLIYIVEDDESIRELESYALKNSDYDVRGFECSTDLFEALRKEKPAMIILDIMLPGDDGLKILADIRRSNEYSALPVIMVTAKTNEIDAVKGLEAGADDYICKPFGVMEFVSRVKAVLRRTKSENPGLLSYREINVDDEKRKVFVSGNVVELTYKEYEILKLLILNRGKVLTRDRIMENVWGYDFIQGNRTVDVHILSIRKKLGNAGDYIKTIVNVGYKLGE